MKEKDSNIFKQFSRWVLDVWHRLSYTMRVASAFALIALATGLVSLAVISLVWEAHFNNYTHESMEQLSERLADNISLIYDRAVDETGEGNLLDIAKSAAANVRDLYPTLGVVVVDVDGNTLYDTTDELVVDAEPDSIYLVKVNPSQTARASIIHNNVVIGSIRVWVYGSESLLSVTDEEFRTNTYQSQILSVLVAVVLAVLVGWVFARKLVAPVKKMTDAATQIKEGNLSTRVSIEGNDEIAHLGQVFDEMAESMENERVLEHRLTSDVAHELRTPLMGIQSTVEAMMDGVYPTDKEHLRLISDESARMGRLVSAMLDLTRLENRSNPVKSERFNFSQFVTDKYAILEFLAEEKKLNLFLNAEPDVYITGDRDLLGRVIDNLVTNAFRYTPENGSITISLYSEGSWVCLEVADTGVGLTPAEIKMVFKRFWRSDEGRARASGGLGVGLTLVKEIVDRHNGNVQVISEKGQGATFLVHLPKLGN